MVEVNEEVERIQTQVEVLKEEKKVLEEDMDDMERRHAKVDSGIRWIVSEVTLEPYR
jgi:predicted  nucleic acid-binding Zn-ribbon protein